MKEETTSKFLEYITKEKDFDKMDLVDLINELEEHVVGGKALVETMIDTTTGRVYIKRSYPNFLGLTSGNKREKLLRKLIKERIYNGERF